MKVPCIVKLEEVSYVTDREGKVLRTIAYRQINRLELKAEGDCFSSIRKSLLQQCKQLCLAHDWVVRNILVTARQATVIFKSSVEQRPNVPPGWGWKAPPATTPDEDPQV